jgi:hypothetical protein
LVVAEGPPAKVLVERARILAADLLVLGARRNRGGLDFGGTLRAPGASSMQVDPSIRFQNIPASPELEDLVRRSVTALERFSDRITSCRVVLSTSGHHRRGNIFHVRIDLGVPGEEIVVNHEAELDKAHANAAVAVHDAFKATRRRLEDHVRRWRGDVKHHADRSRES